MRERIIIVGAGIAGLAVGCYAEMNGYRSEIFELTDRPGGMCASWNRGGYVMDGCIHLLSGTDPASPFYPIWEQLGALQGRPVFYHDELVRIEEPEGKALVAYNDVDRLEQHLLELAPSDAAAIRDYIQALRLVARLDPTRLLLEKPWQIMNRLEKARLLWRELPRTRPLRPWGRLTMQQFGERFHDPFLRQAFPLLHWGQPGTRVLDHLILLAQSQNHTAGWPSGGSLDFARAVERRYLELGGRIHYRAPVERILAPHNQAVGVRLVDGDSYYGDAVVSAADGESTLFGMLDGQGMTERISAYYARPPEESPAGLQVNLGVADSLAGQPHALVFLLDEPVRIADRPRAELHVEIYNMDRDMAPDGKTVVKVTLSSGYAFWKRLRQEGERYTVEKQRVAEAVIAELDKRFPGLKNKVEVVDVATPLTTERFTGTYHGMPPWSTRETDLPATFRGLSRTLPGVENFYMAGQWAGPWPGLAVAAAAGRGVAQMLCHEDGFYFWTSRPAEPRAALWRMQGPKRRRRKVVPEQQGDSIP